MLDATSTAGAAAIAGVVVWEVAKRVYARNGRSKQGPSLATLAVQLNNVEDGVEDLKAGVTETREDVRAFDRRLLNNVALGIEELKTDVRETREEVRKFESRLSGIEGEQKKVMSQIQTASDCPLRDSGAGGHSSRRER